ncbi:MAG: hypothetical protein LUG51_02825 [Tannerellaceae bacterium]|nr:hypothetical protein [Tannerellaceae bacterium]
MQKKIIAAGQVSLVRLSDGKPGTDANLLDWVQEWNTNKTEINGNQLITPKIFAGLKHEDQTVSGVAIGDFSFLHQTIAGDNNTISVNGICGFSKGHTTFRLETDGSVRIGRSDVTSCLVKDHGYLDHAVF